MFTSGWFACCPICGDRLLRGLLVLACLWRSCFGLMPHFLGFRGGAVRLFSVCLLA